MLRLPCCNHDWTTVVLCHLREANIAGIAQKPNDLAAVFGCMACHDWLDDRNRLDLPKFLAPDMDQATLDALVRTLDYWNENGELFTNDSGELRWRPYAR